jgi:hypothetical protein
MAEQKTLREVFPKFYSYYDNWDSKILRWFDYSVVTTKYSVKKDLKKYSLSFDEVTEIFSLKFRGINLEKIVPNDKISGLNMRKVIVNILEQNNVTTIYALLSLIESEDIFQLSGLGYAYIKEIFEATYVYLTTNACLNSENIYNNCYDDYKEDEEAHYEEEVAKEDYDEIMEEEDVEAEIEKDKEESQKPNKESFFRKLFSRLKK